MPLPQRIAALPAYIDSTSNTSFTDAAPGHRFQIYFRNWQGASGNAFASYKSARPQGRDERDAFNRETADTLKDLCLLGSSAGSILTGLTRRQATLIKAQGDSGYTRPAISTAPFATGLGNEHPIENGFAFLTPYGLPYLAGSGVKGVLRRAAEELALENDEAKPEAWTWLDIWWLFGFEGAASRNGPAAALFDFETEQGRAFGHDLPRLAQRDDLRDFIGRIVGDKKERVDRSEDRRADFLARLVSDSAFLQSLHYRGALDFWDCFPQPKDNRLAVEIMTPHFGGYYQKGESPHDAGQPIPVSFLAVPAGSGFDFHAVCRPDRLPETLHSRWRSLLDAACDHAFEWLGFGAKTAVGYGAMKSQEHAGLSASPASDTRAATAPTPATLARPNVLATDETVWPDARLVLNAGTGEIKAIFDGKTTAGIKGAAADELRAALGERASKLRKDKELKNVAVRVRIQGNQISLLGLATN